MSDDFKNSQSRQIVKASESIGVYHFNTVVLEIPETQFTGSVKKEKREVTQNVTVLKVWGQ